MSELNIFTLKNSAGMEVDILNLGATVSAIRFPVADQLQEMTVTYQHAQDFLTDQFYIGATAGRYANRIANGQFMLNDQNYQLTLNNGGNCLHGGVEGFTHRFWEVTQQSGTSITLSLISPDGDQGFPGEVNTVVHYELTENNALTIAFSATSTKDTVINLCNHCYFNLGESDINSLSLKIVSNGILPLNENSIPTGDIRDIRGTDFDFNETTAINTRFASLTDSMLSPETGFDHCYVIDEQSENPVAQLSSDKVSMAVFTDQPGLQFYTAAYLSAPFKPFEGLCLEAQNYPDAPNKIHFPSSVLKAGEHYQKKVSYVFSEK